MAGPMNGYIEVGAFGVICTMFTLVMRYLITTFQRTQRDIHREVLKNKEIVVKHIATNSMIIAAMQKQLLAHDLQIRGINPSSGGPLDKRAELALKVYQQQQDTLEEIVNYIKDMIKNI